MDYRFTLNAVAPFRLDYTVFALRRRSKNKVDLWDRNCYTRVLIIENTPVKVVVEQKKESTIPNCFCTVKAANKSLKIKSMRRWKKCWD